MYFTCNHCITVPSRKRLHFDTLPWRFITSYFLSEFCSQVDGNMHGLCCHGTHSLIVCLVYKTLPIKHHQQPALSLPSWFVTVRRSAPSVNSGPLISRKLLELEIWHFTHIYTGSSPLFGCEFFSARGRVRGAGPPTVFLGPHHISEISRDRSWNVTSA